MAVSFFRGALFALLFIGAQCAPTTIEDTTFASTTEAESSTVQSTTEVSTTDALTTLLSTSEVPETTETLPVCEVEVDLKLEIFKKAGILFRLLVDKEMINGDIWRRVTVSYEQFIQYLQTDSYMEDFIAYIITEEHYLEFQSKCPQLVKKSIYKKTGPRDSTCVGDEAPSEEWEENGAFYCAPEEGVCGANFPVYQVQEYEDDYWLLSDEAEINNSVEYNRTILCYAWKDEDYKTTILEYFKEYQQTIVSKGKKIYHLVFGETWEERYSRYTTDIVEVKRLMRLGFKLEASMSFVVDEETKVEIETECPMLIKQSIFTRDAEPQLNLIDSKVYPEYGAYSETESFYCAPFAGYCGATKPMYYLKLAGGSQADNMFTEDYDEILKYIKQEKYASSTDRLICYGWDDETVYDRTIIDSIINTGSVIYRGFVDKQMPVDWWRRYEISYEKFMTSMSTECYMEAFVGMVIKDDQYEYIKKKCPNLKKKKVYKKKGDRSPSCIRDEAPSSEWELQDSFYCSEEPDYCGANFELMEIAETSEDFFYPSDPSEIVGYEEGGSMASSLCYIWKPINASTPRKKYKSAQVSLISKSQKLYRTVKIEGSISYHVYTFDITVRNTLISQGYVEEAYVSIGVDAATKAELEDDCPYLMPINIYQRSSDPPLTLIDHKVYDSFGPYDLKETFYYAPFQGYCGASRPIYAVYSSTVNVENFYTQNFTEIIEIYYAPGPLQYMPSRIIGYGWDEGDENDSASGSSSSSSSGSGSGSGGD